MTIKQIDQIIGDDNSLKMIAQAYSEIANEKVKKIRIEAERNRLFLEEIGKSYALVKLLALRRKMDILKPKGRVCVLITSNNRFYGAIDSNLIKFFIEQTGPIQTDRVLIGKMGIEHFKSVNIFTDYQTMVMNHDQPNLDELRNIVDLVKNYNQVLVFYSQLKSLLVQEPKILDLTETQSSYSSKDESKFRFVFEPELAKILAFFDSQVTNLLLEGAFLESEVARTASRFISMDQAESQADKLIKEYEKIRTYTKRALENNVILESFAASYARKEESE